MRTFSTCVGLSWGRAGPILIGFIALALSFGRAHAVPAFADQTGQPCAACHVGGFGPQLTPFGREFKLRGYTPRTTPFNVPLSMMAVASYVQTAEDQPAPPADHYGVNDNTTLDQVSLFIAGGVGSHFGVFSQTTYDGVGRSFSWDNIDMRAVTTKAIGGKNAVLGLSLNNSPGVQDPWNTLPAWGFPYTGSDLAPGPAEAPLLNDALAQNVIGMTGYVWWNNQVYLEGGAYASGSPGFLRAVGVDPADTSRIHGAAPYLRVAYQRTRGMQNFEVGAFALWANLYPGRDASAGTDDYADLGIDGSYQLFTPGGNALTFNARYTHENQRLHASELMGAAANVNHSLEDLRADVSYYWKGKVGLSVGGFDTWGSKDPLLYADNRTAAPDSSGATFQLDYTPWGDGHSPFGRRVNFRVGMQYTAYATFEGARSNFDGAGRNASDNDTVRLFSWLAF